MSVAKSWQTWSPEAPSGLAPEPPTAMVRRPKDQKNQGKMRSLRQLHAISEGRHVLRLLGVLVVENSQANWELYAAMRSAVSEALGIGVGRGRYEPIGSILF